MTRFQFLACTAIAVSATAWAQPKPIARADYVKIVDGRFNDADTNHDGSLSSAELVAQQGRDLANAKTRINQQLLVKFNQLDTNHDGKLTPQEFYGAAPPMQVAETADQLMRRLDSNHDGKMTADEWRAPELAKFNKVDANHDGVVTPAEVQAANKK